MESSTKLQSAQQLGETSQDHPFTVGTYLARRLCQIGIRHYFTIPGDFSMGLLDQINKEEGLEMICSCNELNASYSADGYARANGAAAFVLTFNVGSLCAVNGLAGAYAEELPVILICGAPNTGDLNSAQLLHHTPMAGAANTSIEVMRRVTVAAERICDPSHATAVIDEVLQTMLTRRRPVYLEICCNLYEHPVATPCRISWPLPKPVDELVLQDAVEAVAEAWSNAKSPVIVAGAQLRPREAREAFAQVVSASGAAVAVSPDARGLLREDGPTYIGVFMGKGEISTGGCADVVLSADYVLWAGVLFSDYSTRGHTWESKPWHAVVTSTRVETLKGQYSIPIAPFLAALAKRIKANNASHKLWLEKHKPEPEKEWEFKEESKLSTEILMPYLQQLVTPGSTVISDVGESWFLGRQLKLGDSGARFEVQFHYASMGWCLPAAFGVSLGASKGSRAPVLAILGDGAFQAIAQEVASCVRYGARGVIVILNNSKYSIEEVIHKGPYNTLMPWRYADIVNAMNNRDHSDPSHKLPYNRDVTAIAVHTEGELRKAIATTARGCMDTEGQGGLCVLEVILPSKSSSTVMANWSEAVGKYTTRKFVPPQQVAK